MSQSQPAAPPDPSLIPPTEMLHDGSTTIEQFLLYGEAFTKYALIPRTQLQPGAAILDMGCGNGGVARALTRYLSPAGRYEGLDINAATVAWLQEHYAAYPNFGFTHANVWNKMYNPQGQFKAAEYRFPFPDASFDLVLLKSVFTHMMPADLRAYLSEITRVLRPGGRSAITYFLLNQESQRLIDRGLDVHKVRFEFEGDPLCRVSNPDMPEAVVAHDEQRIRGYYVERAMQIMEIAFGDWCGRVSMLGHQDMVIAQRV